MSGFYSNMQLDDITNERKLPIESIPYFAEENIQMFARHLVQHNQINT